MTKVTNVRRCCYYEASHAGQIVAQRDNWENQYRLFEALMSGAMVMTDTMLGLPKGLVDGELIAVYHNLTDLQVQLTHYQNRDNGEEGFAISRRGRLVAMRQHRT